jgi:hypothetical protein
MPFQGGEWWSIGLPAAGGKPPRVERDRQEWNHPSISWLETHVFHHQQYPDSPI